MNLSAVGFGGGHIGEASLSEEEAGRLLNALVDEGVTLFDTARSYGLSEERIGRHLGHRRQEIVLSTKIGYGIDGYEDWTGAIVAPAVHRALTTLRTDVIDIVHLHSCPLDVLERGDVVEALHRCVEAGMVHVAAYSGDDEPAEWAARSGAFGALQTSINLFDQRAIDRILPTSKAIIAKRPLGNAPWRFAERPHGHDAEEYWLRWQALELERDGMSWDELAIRFTLYTPGVSSAIIGSRNLDHMRRNLAYAAKGPLPADLYAAIRTRFQERGADWPGKI